jgi:hypothetical protein
MSIQLELKRYLTIQDILSRISAGENIKSKYEIKNILERWLISMSNDIFDGKEDVIFSRGYLKHDNAHFIKLMNEFKSKGIKLDKVGTISNKVNEYLDTMDQLNFEVKIDLSEEGILSVNDNQFYINMDTLNELLLLDDNIINLAKMLVRYNCLLMGGQQWSIPKNVYEYFVNNFEVSIEGFASPLNHKLDKYCSLFPDTDANYGSIGNFFRLKFENINLLVNPPFVDYVIENMANKIIRNCDMINSPNFVSFIIFVPGWTDANWYKILNMSKYLKYKYVLPKYKHYYINSEDEKINASFETHIFILTANMYKSYLNINSDLLNLYNI